MNTTPREGDIEIRRGYNAPAVQWLPLTEIIADDVDPTSDQIIDFTGSVLYLTIKRGAHVYVTCNTDDDPSRLSFDIPTGVITWTPDIAETRLIPIGRIADYELERRIGATQEPIAYGFVVVNGAGINAD